MKIPWPQLVVADVSPDNKDERSMVLTQLVNEQYDGRHVRSLIPIFMSVRRLFFTCRPTCVFGSFARVAPLVAHSPDA